MTKPFDGLAHSYNQLWSGTEHGLKQRTAVWREIDRLFRPGDRVLDLGCGTGDDALHLADLGVEVFGIDAAPKMVEIARSRGVNASVLSIEDLESWGTCTADGADSLVRAMPPGTAPLEPAKADEGVGCRHTSRAGGPPLYDGRLFSGAISNFGALNCIPDLAPVAAQLARLVQPAGPVAICMMGRFSFTDWRHAPKRFLGHASWRGMDVYYPASRQVRTAFAPLFMFEKRIAIGLSDHQLYVFKRRLEC